ncbi:putative PIP5K1A and PSMD4-like protein [Trichinella spiralis]|uniref:PIP5K1A and PSMD4-like protein n=1 Tax=Trichinella spiralis TaxID=6334 RepID=A0ABR3KZK8_TRISP
MNSKHRIRFTSCSKHCSFLGLILIFVAALTPSWEVLIHSDSVDKIRDRGLFYAYWFHQPPGDVALPRMVNYPAFEFLLIDDRPMNAHAPAYDNISYTTALLLMIGFVLASLKLATPRLCSLPEPWRFIIS